MKKANENESKSKCVRALFLLFMLLCQCFMRVWLRTSESIQTMMFEYYNDDDDDDTM